MVLDLERLKLIAADSLDQRILYLNSALVSQPVCSLEEGSLLSFARRVFTSDGSGMDYRTLR